MKQLINTLLLGIILTVAFSCKTEDPAPLKAAVYTDFEGQWTFTSDINTFKGELVLVKVLENVAQRPYSWNYEMTGTITIEGVANKLTNQSRMSTNNGFLIFAVSNNSWVVNTDPDDLLLDYSKMRWNYITDFIDSQGNITGLKSETVTFIRKQ